MKLGILTKNPEADLKFLTDNKLQSIELLVWPGDTWDINPVEQEAKVHKLAETLNNNNIAVSCIGYYPNWLSMKHQEQEQALLHFYKLFDLAKHLKVNTVATFTGRNYHATFQENLQLLLQFFIPVLQKASDSELQVVFENCPKFIGNDFQLGNMVAIPYTWDFMLQELPLHNWGLEYDPSHLFRLGIDYMKVVNDYGEKIIHVHAKDAEMISDRLFQYGMYHNFDTASRDRFPGFGKIDWQKLVRELRKKNYQGAIDIEGEHDPVFGEEREEEGMRASVKYLQAILQTE